MDKSSPSLSPGEETFEQRQMRRVAFFAVVVSTAAVIASIVTLPMLYSYVQSFQSHLIQETDFCKTRARDIWSEMHVLQTGRSKRDVRGSRGAWLFGQFVPDGGIGGGAGYDQQQPGGYGPVVNAEPAPTCCSCQQGPAGPAGPPGDDGPAGNDGSHGSDGTLGKDGQVLYSALPPSEPCVICPPGPPGPSGSPGQKGPQGPKGKPANKASDGKQGEPGMQGPIGSQGPPGVQGPPGPQGAAGRVIQVNGPAGPAGPRGPRGEPGTQGRPGVDGTTQPGEQGPIGDDGQAGPAGNPGAPGPEGLPGPRGEEGSCDHCPEPRTPPGY